MVSMRQLELILVLLLLTEYSLWVTEQGSMHGQAFEFQPV